MKRLLHPLIAALTLPTAVNDESYWLILMYNSKGTAFEKIEMESLEQCKKSAAIWESTKLGFARGKEADLILGQSKSLSSP